MKLLRAQFENFRLLRDLEIEFSSDAKQNLTVIRAANESGKTTILHGLQWALYGDLALPNKGVGFRLHPIDWDSREDSRVPITATVDIELTKHRRVGNKVRETRRSYRIVRSAYEEVERFGQRSASTVKLFALNDTGAAPIDAPDRIIEEELPPELREVFFTDGDRALSFIEADVARSTKRDRVLSAIRSLLGLGVIDGALNHVQKASGEVNKKAKQVNVTGELNEVASRVEHMESQREKFQSELDNAKQQFRAFDEKVEKTEREIDAALQEGDKEELSDALNNCKENIRNLNDQLDAANKEHSALFCGQSIANDLLSPVLDRAFTKLDELRDEGKIPNQTIPVLQDRLEADLCICGESLQIGSADGERRRLHIQKLIEDSERADEIQDIITNLYFGAKALQPPDESSSSIWLDEYKKIMELRDDLQDRREAEGRNQRALEKKLASLPDTNIQGLRETKRWYIEQRDEFLKDWSSLDTKLEGLQDQLAEAKALRDRLLRDEGKGAIILAELEVTQDVIRVLRSAYERITNEELQRVSDRMNHIFLAMIGTEPEQGANIHRAEISREFDIVVYGPHGRTLNPDRDLNGASRRALTLAFILALTRVSGVEAPNVIDTPLGMMSGYVKRSVLRTAVGESSQLVLLLTHDEISGCEDIIEEAAGAVITLTNPAHYPTMLVNDSRVEEHKVIRCDCDHRNECQICLRRSDVRFNLKMAS